MICRFRQKGFTLIELMIVVVIIGVIIAIAYPSYVNWSRQTRRSDAKEHLSRIAALEQKFFTECNAYTTNLTGGTITGCNGLGYQSSSRENHYAATVTAGSFVQPALSISVAFNINAVPVATGLQVGDGRFGLDSTGARRWDRNNSGGYGAGENTWGK
ncbi:MAG TPA: prepilin-type N-terminal cleavage/methylation domain-containing protein [Acidiferrobacteraceae bacterium]|nr:prepilin-type N-terminal cleavage/methylation domain-containing protein [Acidiferrobacteraceae bacterium]HEX20200.1 prepilin-type N-terminal cleavage/methylation domain-containing protein [Acidiferrobacteraceae bacterium]